MVRMSAAAGANLAGNLQCGVEVVAAEYVATHLRCGVEPVASKHVAAEAEVNNLRFDFDSSSQCVDHLQIHFEFPNRLH